MAGVNKVILLGRLGQDPEVRYMPNGNAVANVSIATSEQWKDKNSGQMQERTEWHRVVFFGRTAEVVGEYLRKGSEAYVEGRLQTKKWQDKNGQDRYTTEIVADKMTMVGGRGSGGDTAYKQADQPQHAAPQQPASQPQQQNTPPAQPFEDEFDDDIPF